ncbi:hypothetical protein ACE3MS_03825 [Paenibacillus dendritiformis]|uniref:hypothetical protein n=1 Tax=Paenibacillus dendritiformis TaxID=130049 RepID=UPI003663449F
MEDDRIVFRPKASIDCNISLRLSSDSISSVIIVATLASAPFFELRHFLGDRLYLLFNRRLNLFRICYFHGK